MTVVFRMLCWLVCLAVLAQPSSALAAMPCAHEADMATPSTAAGHGAHDENSARTHANHANPSSPHAHHSDSASPPAHASHHATVDASHPSDLAPIHSHDCGGDCRCDAGACVHASSPAAPAVSYSVASFVGAAPLPPWTRIDAPTPPSGHLLRPPIAV